MPQVGPRRLFCRAAESGYSLEEGSGCVSGVINKEAISALLHVPIFQQLDRYLFVMTFKNKNGVQWSSDLRLS